MKWGSPALAPAPSPRISVSPLNGTTAQANSGNKADGTRERSDAEEAGKEAQRKSRTGAADEHAAEARVVEVLHQHEVLLRAEHLPIAETQRRTQAQHVSGEADSNGGHANARPRAETSSKSAHLFPLRRITRLKETPHETTTYNQLACMCAG